MLRLKRNLIITITSTTALFPACYQQHIFSNQTTLHTSIITERSTYLHGAGKETGNIHEGDDGDVEGVQEAHEAGGLHGGVNVQAAGQVTGVVRHNLRRS